MAKKNLAAAAAAATEGMFTQIPGQMEFEGKDMTLKETDVKPGPAEKAARKPRKEALYLPLRSLLTSPAIISL